MQFYPPPRALDRRLKKIGPEMQEKALGFS